MDMKVLILAVITVHLADRNQLELTLDSIVVPYIFKRMELEVYLYLESCYSCITIQCCVVFD